MIFYAKYYIKPVSRTKQKIDQSISSTTKMIKINDEMFLYKTKISSGSSINPSNVDLHVMNRMIYQDRPTANNDIMCGDVFNSLIEYELIKQNDVMLIFNIYNYRQTNDIDCTIIFHETNQYVKAYVKIEDVTPDLNLISDEKFLRKIFISSINKSACPVSMSLIDTGKWPMPNSRERLVVRAIIQNDKASKYEVFRFQDNHNTIDQCKEDGLKISDIRHMISVKPIKYLVLV